MAGLRTLRDFLGAGPTAASRHQCPEGSPTAVATAPTTDGAELRALVEHALSGDRASAAQIYARFHAIVLAIQLGNTGGDRQLAADLTQDTFVKALYRLDQFEWRGPESLRNWLATIARNTFRDHVRSAAERHHGGYEVPEVASADGEDDPAAIAERDLDRVAETTGRLLDDLKPEHRHVLRRMVGDGASASELADELGRTEAAIHQLKRRALDAARRTAQQRQLVGARGP